MLKIITFLLIQRRCLRTSCRPVVKIIRLICQGLGLSDWVVIKKLLGYNTKNCEPILCYFCTDTLKNPGELPTIMILFMWAYLWPSLILTGMKLFENRKKIVKSKTLLPSLVYYLTKIEISRKFCVWICSILLKELKKKIWNWNCGLWIDKMWST